MAKTTADTASHSIVCLDGATLYPKDDSHWHLFDALGTLTVYDRTPASEVVARLADADIALTNKTPIDARAIAALPRLRYIGVLATGYNIVDVAAATAAGITVTNIPAYSTHSVAQQAIALLLAITNRVESYADAVRAGRWTACPDFTFRLEDWHELAGKTFGIVGFGNTGRATAAIAAAMGMDIAVYTSKSKDMLPDGYRKVDLDTLFATSDVVSLHCPLTPDTKGLVDSRRLASMKPSAILINTSRGPVVGADALANALEQNEIFAAGIDVLDIEPPTAENPLLQAPRCFITPHVAWSSVEARERLAQIATNNISAFLAHSPVNIVKK